jgi:hypothetical protein
VRPADGYGRSTEEWTPSHKGSCPEKLRARRYHLSRGSKKDKEALFFEDSPQSNRSDILLVSGLAAIIFLYAHLPALTNPYVINDDVRQQIFWMRQWHDPTLFQHDLLADYARHYLPWGVKVLYWLASFVVNPILFSKILPGFLFVLLSATLYRIGSILEDRRLGWFVVCVSWLMPFFIDNLSGGLARAFAAPLLALFWCFWLSGNSRGMALTLLLQALFIPYIFPICASGVIIAWILMKTRQGEPPPFPASATNLAYLALAASLVVLFNYNFTWSGYGPLVRAADMVNRPEFTSSGRVHIVPVYTLPWEMIRLWEFIPPFHELGEVAGSFLCGLLILGALWGGWQIQWYLLLPRLQPIWCLGLASLLWYALARMFLLKLFIPDRYLIYTANLFYCMGLALCFHALTKDLFRHRVVTVGALSLVVVFSALRLQGVGLFDYSAGIPLYSALSKIPKDALVAGHPEVMDNVMTFAHRRALVTFELAQPWSQGHWRQVRPRLEDFFAAYYATDPEVVRTFCRKYRISHLVLDERHFTPDFLEHRPDPSDHSPFFAPFDAYIRNLTQHRHNFILLSRKDFPGKKIDTYVWLIKMEDSIVSSARPVQQN